MDANNITNKITNILAMILTIIIVALIVGGALGLGWNLLNGKGFIGVACGIGLLWFGVSLFLGAITWIFDTKGK